MRTIGVVTTSRADFGIYLPLLRRIRFDQSLSLQLFVSGSHLSPEFGMTIREIEAEGFPVAERIFVLLSSDAAAAIAASTGLAVLGFAQALARARPDILVVLGDRFEMHAAAMAALPFTLPVAHIHGGELTRGAIDDSLRHSLSKMSHLHFVATEEYRRRVIQMGEEPWRVKVCGAPSLDNLFEMRLLTREEIERQFSLRVPDRFLIVTLHPETLAYQDTAKQTQELLTALDATGIPVIFTMPNPDTGNHEIRESIRSYVASSSRAQAVESLGTQAYFSLMAMATAMVGNSSSGIIEAPSFGLPVVNVGSRQEGRVRGRNVMDVGVRTSDILAAIHRVTEVSFRESLRGMENPYYRGGAASTIIDVLKSVALGSELVNKRFHDLNTTQELDLD